jgi:xylulokinase
VLGYPVVVPPPGEYVADGAARQAAWVLASSESTANVGTPPRWPLEGSRTYQADPAPAVRERYAEVRDLTES